jgi:hypothetical protein
MVITKKQNLNELERFDEFHSVVEPGFRARQIHGGATLKLTGYFD